MSFWLNVCVQLSGGLRVGGSVEGTTAVAGQTRPERRMLWNLYQQYRISQLDKKLDRVQDTPTQDSLARSEAFRLEEKLDRLALISRAMFELLQESSGVSEAQLSAKIVEIDLRDGQSDGKMSPKPTRCPKCQAMMSPKFGRCLFCGHQETSVATFV